MKNKKLNDLLKFGLSKKSLLSLNESAINTLHKNLISEKKEENKEAVTTQTLPPQKVVKIPQSDAKSTGANVGGVGISMDSSGNIIAKGPLNAGKEKELGEEKKKGEKKKVNPWAVCHAQLGPKKTAKFERCVMGVKKSIAEGKDPFEVLLEEKILSLVEKHIKPTMKKGELVDLIGKKKMNLPIGKLSSIGAMAEDTETAPAKPATKPGTKPTTKPGKPQKDTPYKPKHKPNPKGETKEAVETAPSPVKSPPKTLPDKKPFTPYKPKQKPNPKGKLPNWMSFDSIGIKLKK